MSTIYTIETTADEVFYVFGKKQIVDFCQNAINKYIAAGLLSENDFPSVKTHTQAAKILSQEGFIVTRFDEVH